MIKDPKFVKLFKIYKARGYDDLTARYYTYMELYPKRCPSLSH
jgi:hypothetical protein